MSVPVTDRLPASSVLRLLGALLLVIGPHLPRLPLWAAALVVALGVWRATVALRGWTLLSAWLRIPLTLLGFFGIYAHYGSLNGQNAGVALLVVMGALKLTEMGARRDYTIVLFLSYFLLVTHFLFSQEIVMVLYLFAATAAITAVLMEINHPQGPLPVRVTLRRSGALMAQAIPVMLVFFVLFPRIPGPIWGLPNDAGSGLTGLSDRMEPGAISQLSQSDAVAFRVTFNGRTPARSEMYWRGPVFWYYDAVGWEEGFKFQDLHGPRLETQGDAIDYEMVLEPHGRNWLLALEMPSGALPSDTQLTVDHQLVSRDRVIDRRLLKLRAHTDYTLDRNLEPRQRMLALRLPTLSNPATRTMMDRWRAETSSDAEIVNRALRLFREEEFRYTLQPPPLQSRIRPVDEFLFGTRSGFCEHYAGAFTVMMRSAGIPARVVTGYQGGEYHEAGGYWIVRQADAHAWSEVWLPGSGWLRIDPTAAVSPSRIELGLGAALPNESGVPALARLNRGLVQAIELRWDMINAGWNRWVLAYGPQLQEDLMRWLGLPGMRELIILLTVLCTLLLGGVSLVLLRQSRPVAAADGVWRLWQQFRRKLQRRGFEYRPAEGPRDLGSRLADENPALAAVGDPIVRLYIRLRYAGEPDPFLAAQLKKRVQRFPRD